MLEAVLDGTKVKVAGEDSTIAIVVVEVLYKLGNLVDKNLVALALTMQAGDCLLGYVDISLMLSVVKKETDRLASILLDVKGNVVRQVNVYLVFGA